MNPRRLFNLVVASIVAAGLLSAPFATPTVARSHAAGGAVQAVDGDRHVMSHATGSHATMSHAAMSDGAMSDGLNFHDAISHDASSHDEGCCPDQGKPSRDCDSCPLLALCAMSIAVAAPSGSTTLARGEAAIAAFALPDDLLIAGLSARPPDHPPRTLV